MPILRRSRAFTFVAWFVAATVSWSTAVAAEPPTAIAPIEPVPSARAPEKPAVTTVKDLAQLELLTKPDNLVSGTLDRLTTRSKASTGLIAGGLIAGLALLIVSRAPFVRQHCDYGPCPDTASNILLGAGVAIVATVPFIGVATRPDREDLDLVPELWNRRHADRPIKLDPELEP